jgi:hypothetical protein
MLANTVNKFGGSMYGIQIKGQWYIVMRRWEIGSTVASNLHSRQ